MQIQKIFEATNTQSLKEDWLIELNTILTCAYVAQKLVARAARKVVKEKKILEI